MSNYPSVRYHPTEPRKEVVSDDEDDALKQSDPAWRDRHYTKKERTALGLGPRPMPVRPKRNDFDTSESFIAAVKAFDAAAHEYVQQDNED